VGIVTVAVAAVSYLSSLAPAVAASKTSTIAWVIGLVWVVTLVNLKSVRAGGALQVVMLTLKLVPLLVVAALAAGVVAGGEAQPPALEAGTISFAAVNGAAALTLWALTGFECASIAARQVEHPERNVPRATLWGTALTGLLYLVVCSAIAMLLPSEVASESPAPFATFVERYWSPGPAALVAVFAIFSCVGAMNGLTLVTAELTRSLAADGLLPRWLGGTDGAGTPRRALVVGAIVASVMGLLNASNGMQALFEFLLLLSTSATLWLYLACALAAFRLGVSRVLAVVGSVFALWMLFGAGLYVSGLSLALMIAGLPIYGWARSERAVNAA
jgi:APA family basic amino acid/polyamine antiporter